MAKMKCLEELSRLPTRMFCPPHAAAPRAAPPHKALPQRASESSCDEKPSTAYTPSMAGRTGAWGGKAAAARAGLPLSDGVGCLVCLGPLVAMDVLTALPCGHEFHSRCIAQWLQQRPVCPLCLKVVPRIARAPPLVSISVTECPVDVSS